MGLVNGELCRKFGEYILKIGVILIIWAIWSVYLRVLGEKRFLQMIIFVDDYGNAGWILGRYHTLDRRYGELVVRLKCLSYWVARF